LGEPFRAERGITTPSTRRFTLITAVATLCLPTTLSILFSLLITKATYYDPRTVTKEDLMVEREMVKLWGAIQNLTVLTAHVDLIFAHSPAVYN